jgi:hypothetical protein
MTAFRELSLAIFDRVSANVGVVSSSVADCASSEITIGPNTNSTQDHKTRKVDMYMSML